MSKKQRIKYRVIPEKLMKDLVEFIDEMQFEAAKVNTTENHHLINLCNYLISCLINSDSFNKDYGKDVKKDDEDKYWTSSSTTDYDYFTFEAGEMSEEEYERLMNAFDSFMSGFNKETKKNKHKKHTPKKTLKKFESDLRRDIDLTPEEKFELYYDEHTKRNNEPISFDDVLKELGIKKPKKK